MFAITSQYVVYRYSRTEELGSFKNIFRKPAAKPYQVEIFLKDGQREGLLIKKKNDSWS